ncbi:MAG: fucose isomerase [Chloroflexi bacterium]|nr:fucose isomerase [Chloroflexota bacterium]
MLKGISPLIQPELLKIIAEMGHGDEIVIGDANFPAASFGKRCVRCDGHRVTEVMGAILQLFPLDTFVETPVTLMAVIPGTIKGTPPIWNEIQKVIDKNEPGKKIGYLERLEFYERSRQAYATVQTSEMALFACVILKKGVIVDN